MAGFPDPGTRADRQVSIPRPPDGPGRRRLVAMDMVNVSWHRYDLGWNVLGDYAAGGGAWGVGARVNSYQWHGMTPLAETPGANPGTGATRHPLHDHLGSTRALFDGGKARLARLDYEPHGQPTRALGAAANRSFTGKQYDAGIGMYHFPYRHYSPSHARWMTRDPLGMVDGPNVYAYVRGAAVTTIDLYGLHSCYDKRTGTWYTCDWGRVAPECKVKRPCRRTERRRDTADCENCCASKHDSWINKIRIPNPTRRRNILSCCKAKCQEERGIGTDGDGFWKECARVFR